MLVRVQPVARRIDLPCRDGMLHGPSTPYKSGRDCSILSYRCSSMDREREVSTLGDVGSTPASGTEGSGQLRGDAWKVEVRR